jgi:DNA-binding transcriptional LysR family regulator
MRSKCKIDISIPAHPACILQGVPSSPLARVDANLLVALEALLTEVHVGRAARRMGVSASAMSHTLGRLRELVGDPLLVRTGQRMSLSPRARELATPLRDGLGLLATALARPSELDPKRERRTVRIAAVDFAQTLLLPELVGLLAREAPGIDVVVTPFGESSVRDLATGELDVALAMHRSTSGLRSRVIHEEPFISCVRRGHPVLHERLTPRRFAALEHVLISPRGRVVGAVDDALRARGLKRRVVAVVTTFVAAALVVASSDLVLTCAERSGTYAKQWLGLQLIRPPITLAPARLGMYWHERHTADALLGWLRERIAELVATIGGRR